MLCWSLKISFNAQPKAPADVKCDAPVQSDLLNTSQFVYAAALDGASDWVPQVWRELDTTLVAAPLGAADTAIMLGRPGGPAFRPSEVARLGYLSGIVATLLQ